MEYSTAHRLAGEIKNSEEYRTYHDLKDEVMGDATTAALIAEYKKLQLKLSMAAMSGQQADETDMQRFQGINSVLFMNPQVQQYMLAEMRLQQTVSDIFRIVSQAADLDMNLPGLEG